MVGVKEVPDGVAGRAVLHTHRNCIRAALSLDTPSTPPPRHLPEPLQVKHTQLQKGGKQSTARHIVDQYVYLCVNKHRLGHHEYEVE